MGRTYRREDNLSPKKVSYNRKQRAKKTKSVVENRSENQAKDAQDAYSWAEEEYGAEDYFEKFTSRRKK